MFKRRYNTSYFGTLPKKTNREAEEETIPHRQSYLQMHCQVQNPAPCIESRPQNNLRGRNKNHLIIKSPKTKVKKKKNSITQLEVVNRKQELYCNPLIP